MEDYKKKYEDALDNFKKIKAANKDNKELVDFIEYEYPELKREDERIRQGILELVRQSSEVLDKQNQNNMIAWLEKQSEQKSTDKVEPKFKVGDWIINSEGMLRHILAVDKSGYQTDYGWLTHDIYDNTYHLWTIQDAKDGDVLATDNGGICIFDGTVEEGIYPFAYCGLTRYGFEFYDRKLPFTHDNNVYPATKEQRDLLFQKMKEAGYEWDNEKKELKKIEQKPAWSGEDSCCYDDICEILINLTHSPKSNVNKDVVQKDLDWLKSLKERCTWKPSKEQIEAFEHFVRGIGESGYASPYDNNTKLLYSLLQQLKKLREE